MVEQNTIHLTFITPRAAAAVLRLRSRMDPGIAPHSSWRTNTMGDLWQSGWATEGLNVFVVAFLGAFLGYAFSRYQSTQEHKSKQAVLLTHLHRELSLLGEEDSLGDRHALSLRVPIRVNVIPRLLDGDLLGYREHV